MPRAVAGLVSTFAYNDLDDLGRGLRAHQDAVAAVVLEPSAAEVPAEGYLAGVVGLARWNTPANLVTPTVVAAVALALLYQLAPRSISGSVTTLFARLGPVPQGALIGAGLAGITYLGPSGVPPFIYYRF